jgi:phosphomevalonate kinase
MSEKTTLVSAPGKVLLAGGFLVLDPQYFGIVISTSARFYTLIRPLQSSSSTSTSDGIRIKVQAAQFPKDQSVWEYNLAISGGKVELKPVAEKDEGNKFVQLTIDCALRYALEVSGEEGLKGLGSGVEIIVLADNDFYSQSDKVSHSFRFPEPFLGTCVLRVFRVEQTSDGLLLTYRPTLPSPHSHHFPTQSAKPIKPASDPLLPL